MPGPSAVVPVSVVPTGGTACSLSRDLATLPTGSAPAWDERRDVLALQASSTFQVGRMSDSATSTGEAPPRIVKHYWHDRLFAALFLALAAVDNALSYAAFVNANGVGNRMYNIVDMQLKLVMWLVPALVAFAGFGTLCFVALVVLVECHKTPLYHEIMNVRIYLSAVPCAFLCGIVAYYSEQSKPLPFATLLFIMFFTLAWCVHMRLRWSFQLNTCSRTMLDTTGFLALTAGLFLIILFLAGRLDIITKSSDLGCPFAANEQMPVHVPVLRQWYCAPWESHGPTMLHRRPVEDQPQSLGCTSTFMDAFGTSLHAHAVECPAGCLQQAAGVPVTGCGVYTLESPVCVAAIHSGALPASGGRTVVYGRLGLAKFQQCSRNSFISEEPSARTRCMRTHI